MDALTLDQIQIFLTVVDEGSFTVAAKRLNRARSAVTYGIQKLEAQIGLPLFDRSAYRPTLTDAGRILLVRARRIAQEADTFKESAESLASGLEGEVSIVVNSMFPMPMLLTALKVFAQQFPTVPPRICVRNLGVPAQMVLDGTSMIGLFPAIYTDGAMKSFPVFTMELVPVVSSEHPLAAVEGPINTHALQQHVQLVLTDGSVPDSNPDLGVLSARNWRLADLGVKHAMLLAGLGWGTMPLHMVEDDIAHGRLKVVWPEDFEPPLRFVMSCAYLMEPRLGPAAQWLLRHLLETRSVS
ncbi:LysR family transcriptional regulator [Luteibacter pinisoli]|uniref:LysR family transcriptional regulator n=1 Tax=Luteibacter pinisoli TaxID=2589080 RepID=A0A4Y5YY45_9GAMM|nr:LysR family transcriptional regulator [Luteibacter pinisoli]QDE37744.1 LysR family transcriptional regulator [Luteibacter pinisoli]